MAPGEGMRGRGLPGLAWAILATALLPAATSVALARGEIVPEKTRGVKIVSKGKGTVAHWKKGNAAIELRLSTANGFVFLDIELTNMGAETLEVGPSAVKLLSEGTDDVQALSPERYAELAYNVTVSEADLAGRSDEADEDGGRPRDRRKGRKRPRRPGPSRVRDLDRAPGRSIAESMIDAQDPEEAEEDERRKKALKEFRRLRRDAFTSGGSVPPGTTVRGRLVYVRSHCDPPFVVEVRPGKGRAVFRFARRK